MPVSFDPCTFAQESLRPVREGAGATKQSDKAGRVSDAFGVLELAIKDGLKAIADCESFEGRERMRFELAKTLKSRRDALVRAAGTSSKSSVAAELDEVLRSASAVAMAFL